MSLTSPIPLMYFADGGIVVYNLWEPFTSDQLVRYVDDFADCGVDLLSQMVFTGGSTKPGLFVPEHPEFEWWDNRFLHDLIDRGMQPLEIIIRRAHERDMRFFCKLRMADWHRRTKEESGFIGRHPELQNPDFPERPRLDYTHREVHDYHLSLISELARRFDIDGITLNFIRGWDYFPKGEGSQKRPIMTSFIRRVRGMLDERKRGIELGVIVPPMLNLCAALGLDVAGWIEEDLIDYVSPGNGHYSDPNMDHRAWSARCADTRCRYFPMLQNMVGTHDDVNLLDPDQLRAVVKGMSAGGADGISVFNWVYYWARRGGTARYAGPVSGHPRALGYLRELRDDGRPRHYWFRPIGMEWQVGGRTYRETDRVAFPRRVGARGEYRFRLPENLDRCGQAQLFVHVLGLTPMSEEDRQRVRQRDLSTNAEGLADHWDDQIEVDVNGHMIPSGRIRRVFHPDGRLEKFGRPLAPYTTLWFELAAPPACEGENTLGVKVIETIENGDAQAVIEEVEIVVMPQPIDR